MNVVAETVASPEALPAHRSHRGDPEQRRLSLLVMALLGLAIGVITGLGAVVFRDLIGLVHNIGFLGRFSFFYDSSEFTPWSRWGDFVILVPVVGGLIVTWLTTTFAPEARGHGVPEVMDAIYYKRGVIRPVVAVVKSLASAVSIGTGAAVGREGPIIQIGSALGSTLGQILPMPASSRITLVAAGAGAGIAATFNTPIGGVLFAIELMLPEVSVNTFLPVAVATGSATFIGRIFFGAQPAFLIPAGLAPVPLDPFGAVILVLFAVLGGVTGVAAMLFVRVLHWLEDLFDRIANPYLRHAVGMALVGLLIDALFHGLGHYYVEGVGYSTIQSVLRDASWTAGPLLLLFACKLAATSISLGSGSSGGVFSPSLFMGATLGGCFGSALAAVFPGLGISVPAFAMVGMGSMVGGGTGAAMTAVTMIFEMTRDYEMVMPMIVAVAVSLGVRRMLIRENIYTMKLVRRGHPLPRALHANMFLVRSAREVMQRDVLVLPAETPFADFVRETAAQGGLRHVVITRAGRISGVLRVNLDLRASLSALDSGTTLGDVAQRNFTVARETDVTFDVITRLWRHDATMAVVTRGRGLPRGADVAGVITKETVADSVAASVQIYPR